MTREVEDNEAGEQMLNQNNSSEMIKDKYYLIYILFYFLGTTTLIPSNFFTTATDYWMYKFRDPALQNYSSENRTGLQAEFVSDYSIVSNVSNVIFIIATIFLAKKGVGMTTRIITGLCGAIVMFAVTCLFVQINTDSWQMTFFVITLFIGFLLTGFCAMLMVTVFMLVSKFPAQYLAALFSGHSICGIFAALVQIFCLSIASSSTITGLAYFCIGMFFIFLTLIGFLTMLKKSEFLRYYINLQTETTVQPKITKEMFLTVLNKIKFYLSSMIIVLGCSIMIHPGIASLVVSVDKGSGNQWNDVYFGPVVTFLIYFVCDYVGRELAGFIRRPKSDVIIFIASVLRIGFVPMIMLCNAQPRHHLPVVFAQDFVYIIFIIIFALSNGYLVNLCAVEIPTVTEEEEKKLSMMLIVVFMFVSLGTCAFLNAALVKAL